jgi:drug/metabolite transporter (DMT)-like permease
MGRFEKQPDNPRPRGDLSRAAENALWTVVEDLENLQQNVLRLLLEDVKRLEADKKRLVDDIQQLAEEKEKLQQARKITEQQVLIRQIAEVLAKHISTQLQSSLKELTSLAIETESSTRNPLTSGETNGNKESKIQENVGHMFDTLDDTVTIAFNSLQQELKNYQSNISQQLSRMYNQQQQGEAILEEFINRLQQGLERTPLEAPVQTSLQRIPAEVELRETSLNLPLPPENTPNPQELISEPPVIFPPRQENTTEPISVLELDLPEEMISLPPVMLTPAKETKSEPVSVLRPDLTQFSPGATPRRRRSRKSPGSSPLQVGLLLIVLSTVISSLYNVVIRVIFHSDTLGQLAPTVGNIMLILVLRFMVVVPLMLLLAPILHPLVWEDLKNLFNTTRRNRPTNSTGSQRVLVLSIFSGCVLFLSQVLIYMAIGQIPTGIAIALFFIYPLISGLLSSFLLGDRLRILGVGAMGAIFGGELLVLGGSSTGLTNNSVGTGTAIVSGLAFAVYVILTRICANKIHPVSFSLINFITMFVLSFILLMVPLPDGGNLVIDTSKLLEIVLSAFMLGVLTLCGYLLNNFGTRKLGPSKSTVIGAAIPVLTVIFAGMFIQETLDINQVIGVFLVAFGAAVLGWEKMQSQQVKSSSSPN